MIHFVVFSRYRPLQLHGYLRSLFQNYVGTPHVSVLVKLDERYVKAYGDVMAEFPGVEFWTERDFASDLAVILGMGSEPFTCFGCDDALFVRPLDPYAIEQASDGLVGLSLRLGAENVERGMSGRPMPLPSTAGDHVDTGHFRWDVTDPSAVEDWAYMWEVLGTVYRTDFVRRVVAALDSPGSPSQLEDRGSRCWQEHTPLRTMGAFPTAPLIVPTVNIVQTEFGNGFVGDVALRAPFLLECWDAGLRMDTERFAQQRYDTWRVPNFYLRRLT